MRSTVLIRRWTARAILVPTIAAAITVPVYSQQSAPAGEASVAAVATPSQVQAREILMRMARFLSTAQSFSVSLNSGYDAVQNSGQKIEFDERRKMIINRPDRLRAETERSDGSKVSVVLTGKEIVLVDPTNNVYAIAPQPGGLDESIVYFVSNLGMRLPLAVLLVSQAPGEFEDRVRTIDYVEKTNILGTPSHHLAGRTDTVDFQFWISDGEQPFPQRIVLTYRTEPGQPQFWAQFADWRLSPAISASTFSPQIPAGAQKIAFAAQLSTVSPATHKPPTDKGAK